MQSTYTAGETVALKDEHAEYTESLREHEATCFECFHGYPCLEGFSMKANLESLSEALGWDARADEQASQEPLSDHTRALYWWSDRSTVSQALGSGEPEDRWDELVGDQDDNPNSPNARPGVIRATVETKQAGAWLDVLTHLGDTEATRNAYQAALRIWFPKQNDPLNQSDVAIYKTFLNIKKDADGKPYADAYCSACKQRALVRPTARELVATIRHALSHAPAHVQRGVEFDEGGDSFRLTDSTAKTTSETLRDSFMESGKYYYQLAETYMLTGDREKEIKARAFASWHFQAATKK